MVEVENAGGGVKGQVAPDSRGRCSWQRPLSAPAAPDTTYYSCQLRLLLLLLRFLLAAPASHSRSGCSDERALGKQVRGRSLLPQIPCCSGTRESCVHDRGLVPALSLSTGIGLFARSPKQEVNPPPRVAPRLSRLPLRGLAQPVHTYASTTPLSRFDLRRDLSRPPPPDIPGPTPTDNSPHLETSRYVVAPRTRCR